MLHILLLPPEVYGMINPPLCTCSGGRSDTMLHAFKYFTLIWYLFFSQRFCHHSCIFRRYGCICCSTPDIRWRIRSVYMVIHAIRFNPSFPCIFSYKVIPCSLMGQILRQRYNRIGKHQCPWFWR